MSKRALSAAVRCQRRLSEDPPHLAKAAHQAIDVVALGEVVRIDQRRSVRVGASIRTLPRLFGCSRQTWHE